MHSPALRKALVEIEALGTHEIDLIRAANFRLQLRTRRREKVIRFMADDGYWPLMGWLSELAPRRFLSIDEARAWLRKEIRRIRSYPRDDWKFRDNSHRLPGLRDRLIIASYFSRFGAEIWQREAA